MCILIRTIRALYPSTGLSIHLTLHLCLLALNTTFLFLAHKSISSHAILTLHFYLLYISSITLDNSFPLPCIFFYIHLFHSFFIIVMTLIFAFLIIRANSYHPNFISYI